MACGQVGQQQGQQGTKRPSSLIEWGGPPKDQRNRGNIKDRLRGLVVAFFVVFVAFP